MILIGALFATLFLGGYQSPIGEQWILALPVWLESVALRHRAGAQVRGLAAADGVDPLDAPRFRVDQVMRLCWLTLVPLCRSRSWASR